MQHLAFAVKSCERKLNDINETLFVTSLIGDAASQIKTIYKESAKEDASKGDDLIFNLFVVFKESVDFSLFKDLRAKALAGEYELQGEKYRFDVFALENDFPNLLDGNSSALVMDMDMTTVQMEGIDEIARRVGVYDEVAAITHSAMAGNLDFKASLTKRVALLKGGYAEHIIADIGKEIPFTPGLIELIKVFDEFRAKGNAKVCIASGGFHELIKFVDDVCHFDAVAANRLEVDAAGNFTGKVVGEIVDAQGKADFVKSLKNPSTGSGIAKERIVVIGDGANDLVMMAEGGMPFAYHAKPKVQEQVDNVINFGNLSTVAAILKFAAMAAAQ